MKIAIGLFLLLLAFAGLAQTPPFTPVRPPTTAPNPAPTTPQPGVLTPNNPNNPNQNPLASTVLSNVVGMAGNLFSNRFGLTNPMALSNAMVFSNLFGGGNIALSDVEGLFQTLQVDIEQALPILAGLTGGTGVGTTTTNAGLGGPATGSSIGTAGVGGVNVGSGNTTVGTAGSTTPNAATAPNQSASRTSPFLPPSPMLPATGNPAAPAPITGQTPGTTSGQTGFFGTLGTNTVQMDQQTFQLLLALQNNLQQTLPILQSLNSSGPFANNGANGNQDFSGGFSNRVGVVTNRILQNRGVMLPTGRR